ncbi:hypothetical protein GCM10022295_91370 [Streptomyces osmaniensis]|uniref:Transposase n=1 Tax=Streptomyces osmaniensis TaxID=593134 RepID=A0ABP6Z2M5_9ACTN
MAEADCAPLIKGWFPACGQAAAAGDLAGDRQAWCYIKSLLVTVTVSTIHQRLRDEHGLTVSISSLRRWIAATLPEEKERSQVTVLRNEVEPGLEAQIGYGFLGQWVNPRSGRWHRVWAFVLVLPCSRHMFVPPPPPPPRSSTWTSTPGLKRTSRPPPGPERHCQQPPAHGVGVHVNVPTHVRMKRDSC